MVHYVPATGKTASGPRYTDNGFWDTARTVYPLFSLIARDEFAEMLEGFVNDYRESGWLPRWLSIGEVGLMPSTYIDCVLLEAVHNGIGRREDWEDGFEGTFCREDGTGLPKEGDGDGGIGRTEHADLLSALENSAV